MSTLQRIDCNGRVEEPITEVFAGERVMKKGTYDILESKSYAQLSKDDYIAHLEAELRSFRGHNVEAPEDTETLRGEHVVRTRTDSKGAKFNSRQTVLRMFFGVT